MKTLLLALFFPFACLGAFTEFYCQTTGNNLNAGSTTDDTAPHTYAGGTFVRATGIFTVASGDPSADGVASNQWASIYTTAGATVATCVGRITNVSTTTITIDLNTLSGAAANVSEAAAAATCKVGGAWKGPNAAAQFPFNFITSLSVNAPNFSGRVNFKTGTYTVSAAMTHSLTGPITFQGYSSSPGDGAAKATFDANSTDSIVTLMTVSAGYGTYVDLIWANNKGSGCYDAVTVTGNGNMFIRCVVHDMNRGGFWGQASQVSAIECEAYNMDLGNYSDYGSFNTLAYMRRCISHDNTAANANGFRMEAYGVLDQCIASKHGNRGFDLSGASAFWLLNCEAYSNGRGGIAVSGSTLLPTFVENCNFLNNSCGVTNVNTGTGINRLLYLYNCGFGTGSAANTNGNIIGFANVQTNSCVNYASGAVPWNAVATGDFSISLTAAKAMGRGAFTETAGGYSGTVGYPDIGAAQSASTNTAAASGGSWTFAQ